jgi:hypothetical protein
MLVLAFHRGGGPRCHMATLLGCQSQIQSMTEGRGRRQCKSGNTQLTPSSFASAHSSDFRGASEALIQPAPGFESDRPDSGEYEITPMYNADGLDPRSEGRVRDERVV